MSSTMAAPAKLEKKPVKFSNLLREYRRQCLGVMQKLTVVDSWCWSQHVRVSQYMSQATRAQR
jgi:hypothetical protein